MEAEDSRALAAATSAPEMKPENARISQKSKHNRYCVEKMYGVSVAVDSLER